MFDMKGRPLFSSIGMILLRKSSKKLVLQNKTSLFLFKMNSISLKLSNSV